MKKRSSTVLSPRQHLLDAANSRKIGTVTSPKNGSQARQSGAATLASENALFETLEEQARLNGWTIRQLISALGISLGTYYRNRANKEPPIALSGAFRRAAAGLLRVGEEQCLVLAGHLRKPQNATEEALFLTHLDALYAQFRRDPVWGWLAPAPNDWNQLAEHIRAAIALQYGFLQHVPAEYDALMASYTELYRERFRVLHKER